MKKQTTVFESNPSPILQGIPSKFKSLSKPAATRVTKPEIADRKREVVGADSTRVGDPHIVVYLRCCKSFESLSKPATTRVSIVTSDLSTGQMF